MPCQARYVTLPQQRTTAAERTVSGVCALDCRAASKLFALFPVSEPTGFCNQT